MFQFFAQLVLVGFFSGFSMSVFLSGPAQMPDGGAGPRKVNENSLGIEISAPYAVIVDNTSGRILYGKNHNIQSSVASITKLMTSLVFLKYNPGWDTVVTMQSEDIRQGNIVYIIPGEEVTVRDLFHLTLISSANEAALALVRSTGFSQDEFVALMNDEAESMGLYQTYFIDPTGLEPANISTAYEVAQFSQKAFENSDIRSAVLLDEYSTIVRNSGRRIYAHSTDRLLQSFINDGEFSYELNGAKTGFIPESDYCFASQVSKNENAISVVVLGSVSDEHRWKEVKGLIDWTFENYQWP